MALLGEYFRESITIFGVVVAPTSLPREPLHKLRIGIRAHRYGRERNLRALHARQQALVIPRLGHPVGQQDYVATLRLARGEGVNGRLQPRRDISTPARAYCADAIPQPRRVA